MASAWLGIGSNCDPEQQVAAAMRWLREQFIDAAFSPVYRSQAVGFEGQDFLNLAARVETSAGPLELKAMLTEFEDQNGRRRDVPKFSDRVIDIDLLLYDDLVLDHPDLVLPRAEITRYAHVLRPLADLAPSLVMPGQQQTLAELWAAFPAIDPPLVETPLDPDQR